MEGVYCNEFFFDDLLQFSALIFLIFDFKFRMAYLIHFKLTHVNISYVYHILSLCQGILSILAVCLNRQKAIVYVSSPLLQTEFRVLVRFALDCIV